MRKGIYLLSLVLLLVLMPAGMIEKTGASQQFSSESQRSFQTKEQYYEWVHSEEFLQLTAPYNPDPSVLNEDVEKLSSTYGVPPIIVKAVMFQESSWRQFLSEQKPWFHKEKTDQGQVIGVGIGLMQVTVFCDGWNFNLYDSNRKAVDRNQCDQIVDKIVNGTVKDDEYFALLNLWPQGMRLAKDIKLTDIKLTDEFIDVHQLINDFKYNLEIGVRILLAKWVAAKPKDDHLSTHYGGKDPRDPSLLENWYYPLAFYNGFTAEGRNDPANSSYARNGSFTGESFPYQERIFNIIAQLPNLGNIKSYFGDPIKVTLPGPKEVCDGKGKFPYVDANFRKNGPDDIVFFLEETAQETCGTSAVEDCQATIGRKGTADVLKRVNGMPARDSDDDVCVHSDIMISWEPRVPMPTARAWTSSVVYDGKIYVIGGVSCLSNCQQFYNSVNTLEVYDPTNDIWTVLAPMNVRRAGSAVSALGGKIYVFGGFNRDTWSTNRNVEIYDIATNTWSFGAPMPTPRSWMKAAVVDGKIYVIGGVGYGYRRDVEVYNPTTNSWEVRAPLPGRERYLHAVVAYKGKIYVIGGDSWGRGYNEIWDDIWEYDPATNTWTEKSRMPSPATDLDAVAVDGKIWVLGSNRLCRVYDIEQDQWHEVNSNQNPSGTFSLAFLNGYIYRFGGGGWGPTLNVTERAKIKR